MDEDSQINSSPSILIPELPGTTVQNSPEYPGIDNQLSETYTPSDIYEENAQAVSTTDNDAPNVYDTVWYPGIVFDNANLANENNDSAQTSHSNDSNQSERVLPLERLPEPWRPVLDVYEENSRQSTSESITHHDEESKHCDRPAKTNADPEEPPAKVRKLDTSIQDDGEVCPICLECWGNSGEHRLVALRCGHLFGARCVERWLRAQPTRERACPTCKSRATLKDVRPIYARRLIAADTTQITALQQKIELLQQEKNRSESELQKSRIAHRACMLQLEDLRNSLLKTQVKEQQPVQRPWRFALEKNLEINKDGGCRVLTYNCRTYELYISQKSHVSLFPGYGIRSVNCVDFKLGQFLRLHPKPIRDITYSQPRDLLLSVALDKTARIVERGALNLTIPCELPLWSCTWDYLRSNEFYVGGTGGVIQQYDIRNPGTYIEKFNIATDLSPVVSLVSTEYGLLSCQLNSFSLWTSNSRRWDRRTLPVEGPFMSLCYDSDSHRVLVSTRAGTERAKLHLCKVKSSYSDVSLEYEQVFSGSARTSVMCGSAFVKVPGSAWVASHCESEASLDLHGVDGCRSLRLPASEPAVAVCSARVNDATILAALSESRLRLYRAQPSRL